MVVMRNLKKIQKDNWLSRLKRYFNVRLAIIEVRPGETREDSWKRHLTDNPEANYANIRIFNRTNHDQDPLNSGTGHLN
jgi:hypothetical protein